MDVIKATLTVKELDDMIKMLAVYAKDTRIDGEIRDGWGPLAENLKLLRSQQASAYTIEAVTR
jgi:hypothetical protein